MATVTVGAGAWSPLPGDQMGELVGGALPLQPATAMAAAKARTVREVRMGRSCGDMIEGLRR
jgi:hypothetical protein